MKLIVKYSDQIDRFLKVTTRHAICAIIYLAKNGIDRIVTAKEISSERKIPISYLPRILSKMVKKGIIRSFHGGREKGYMIDRDLHTISLFEIFNIFEGWTEKECLLRPGDNEYDCPAKFYWKTIEEEMFKPFKKITLAVICNEYKESVINKILNT